MSRANTPEANAEEADGNGEVRVRNRGRPRRIFCACHGHRNEVNWIYWRMLEEAKRDFGNIENFTILGFQNERMNVENAERSIADIQQRLAHLDQMRGAQKNELAYYQDRVRIATDAYYTVYRDFEQLEKDHDAVQCELFGKCHDLLAVKLHWEEKRNEVMRDIADNNEERAENVVLLEEANRELTNAGRTRDLFAMANLIIYNLLFAPYRVVEGDSYYRRMQLVSYFTENAWIRGDQMCAEDRQYIDALAGMHFQFPDPLAEEEDDVEAQEMELEQDDHHDPVQDESGEEAEEEERADGIEAEGNEDFNDLGAVDENDF